MRIFGKNYFSNSITGVLSLFIFRINLKIQRNGFNCSVQSTCSDKRTCSFLDKIFQIILNGQIILNSRVNNSSYIIWFFIETTWYFFAKMYRKNCTKYLKMVEIAPKNCTKWALKFYWNYIEKFKNSHFISGTLA